MAQMTIEQYVVGPFMTNCYFAINEDTKETLVIDPGFSGEALIQKLEKENLKPAAILLTHGHLDHAGNAELIANRYQIKIYAHEEEKNTFADPRINLTGFPGMGAKATSFRGDVWLKDNELVELAGFEIKVLFTPGHTPGGCCYYFKEAGIVFVGDTLFNGSVGRTDFPGGSEKKLLDSVRTKLFTLPDETQVYPGHNELTTIQAEKMYNPFFTEMW